MTLGSTVPRYWSGVDPKFQGPSVVASGFGGDIAETLRSALRQRWSVYVHDCEMLLRRGTRIAQRRVLPQLQQTRESGSARSPLGLIRLRQEADKQPGAFYKAVWKLWT